MRKPDLTEMPASETGALSRGEERFNVLRQRAGFVAAPLVFLALWFAPLSGLEANPHAQPLLAVLGLVVALWVTEAIPLAITALLGPALCVVMGIGSTKDIFKSFADPIIFLFIGSFLLAEAIYHHGLNRRIAFRILSLPGVGDNPSRLLLAFGAITYLLSMWISNTTTTAMMLPVGVSILSEMARRKSEQAGREVHYTELKFGTGLLLMTAFAASIGGFATPVGTAPNLIGIGVIEGRTGIQIPFFKWMMFGLPLSLALVIFLMVYLKRMFPAEPGLLRGNAAWLATERSRLGPLSRGEINVLVAFVLTVGLWILPGFVAVAAGTDSPAYKWLSARLPESIVALLGAALLFFLPVNLSERRFTLAWAQAKRIDWGTILLFGGGITLGELMFTTGLASWIGNSLVQVTEARTTFTLVLLFAGLGLAVTETASNTASASMLVPVAIAVAQSAGVNPLQPALAACLGATLGCMLPVSTPPNAIVYGSGCVPLPQMIKNGFALNVFGLVAIVSLVMLLIPRLF